MFLLDIDRPVLNVSVSKIILNETDQLYVLCASTSNPSAEYHWVDSTGASVVNAPLLAFPALKRSDAKTYSCIANNKIDKKTSANLTVEVNCKWCQGRLSPVFLQFILYLW